MPTSCIGPREAEVDNFKSGHLHCMEPDTSGQGHQGGHAHFTQNRLSPPAEEMDVFKSVCRIGGSVRFGNVDLVHQVHHEIWDIRWSFEDVFDFLVIPASSKDFSDAGYTGDVWFPQPAPKDHPWRYMPNHAMTPHISGTTIDAYMQLYQKNDKSRTHVKWPSRKI
ncbi:hypothetical protein QQ045_004046 [Rhodiola kirilowii]